MTDDRTPNCACTVPGMVCAQHKDLPIHERPQPPLFDNMAAFFGRLIDTELEAQVDEWANEQREDH